MSFRAGLGAVTGASPPDAGMVFAALVAILAAIVLLLMRSARDQSR
jgi:hypothetical protein